MKSTRRQLEKILCTSHAHFKGDSGSYGPVMAKCILDASVEVGGFFEALETFVASRRLVLQADIKAGARRGGRHWHHLWDQLEQFDRNLLTRFRGKRSEKVTISISARGPYGPLYRRLKKRKGSRTTPLVGLKGAPLSIRRVGPHALKLTHASAADMPRLLAHLSKLWDRVLRERCAETLAEFEWWFFAANPTGRCGASLGDCLSLALRLKCAIPLRKRFLHLDWEALGCDLETYKKKTAPYARA